MRRARLLSAGALFVACLTHAAPASAFPFEDLMAYGQRLLHYKMQFEILLKEAQQNRELFENTFKAMKTGDWKSLSLVDTLSFIESPWFDKVENIDKIRQATALGILNVEAAQRLWKSADAFVNNKKNPRYGSDPWFKRKVDSLTRQSKRARSTRAALLRQMEAQNRQLIADVKHIDDLRTAIQKASLEKPVNQAKIASLQADLSAVQARYQGQNMLLVNQRAIMNLVGEEDANDVFMEQLDDAWEAQNTRALTNFGRAFGK